MKTIDIETPKWRTMKKNKAFLFIILILGMNICVCAQTSTTNNTGEYWQALTKYLEVSGALAQMNVAQEDFDVTAFAQLAKQTNKKLSKKRCEELAQLYIDEKVGETFIGLLVPYAQKYVSLDDLNAATALYSQPEVQTAIKHVSKASTDMGQDMVEVFRTMQPVLAEDCPESYKDACRELYEVSNIETTLTTMVDALMNSGWRPGTKDAPIEPGTFRAFLKDNLFNIFLNYCNGCVTEEDAHAYTTAARSSATQGMVKVFLDIAPNMENIMRDLVKQYVFWVRWKS